ncbi:hypothetical protein B9479_004584 [Cryptococcus floricola]|uniref:Uncharacterized protein n=1 Tax=Cryptococcus floricola TaxID=2591691 RepID=A0A5D3AY03_9TREE|nr:hypothetical protein B9479_004584 [Cryptococcus floricola]
MPVPYTASSTDLTAALQATLTDLLSDSFPPIHVDPLPSLPEILTRDSLAIYLEATDRAHDTVQRQLSALERHRQELRSFREEHFQDPGPSTSGGGQGGQEEVVAPPKLEKESEVHVPRKEEEAEGGGAGGAAGRQQQKYQRMTTTPRVQETDTASPTPIKNKYHHGPRGVVVIFWYFCCCLYKVRFVMTVSRNPCGSSGTPSLGLFFLPRHVYFRLFLELRRRDNFFLPSLTTTTRAWARVLEVFFSEASE